MINVKMKKKTKKTLIILGVIIGIILLTYLSSNKTTLSISLSVPNIIKLSSLSIGDDWWRCINQNCAGECKECSSGGSICCEGSRWTISPNCNVCTGENCECLPPGGGDCSEYPSKSLDCERYCTVSGHIYQYNTDECCPPDFPYQKVGTHSCYNSWTSDLGSDNYYTRHSECHKGEENCDGVTYKYCEEVSSFIFKYKSQEIVKGKCGVECISNPECSNGEIEKVCQGNDLMGKYLRRLCISYKCIDSGYGYNLIEHCEYKCENGVCVPEIPQPDEKFTPVWVDIVSKLWNWLKSIFKFFGLTIVGETNVTVGSSQTYSISLSANMTDSDYSDGSYQLQYGSWALIKNNGDIIKEGIFEKVNGSYNKIITINVPSSPNNYILTAVIYQYNMIYNPITAQWEKISEEVVAKEGINIITKAPYPTIEPYPLWNNIVSVLKDIWNWFKNLLNF